MTTPTPEPDLAALRQKYGRGDYGYSTWHPSTIESDVVALLDALAAAKRERDEVHVWDVVMAEPDPTRACPNCGASWTAEVDVCPECPAAPAAAGADQGEAQARRSVAEFLKELNARYLSQVDNEDDWHDWLHDQPELDRDATASAMPGDIVLVDGTLLVPAGRVRGWVISAPAPGAADDPTGGEA